MPPVPGAEGSFYAEPGSTEITDLDRRWKAGEFLARVEGKLSFDHDGQKSVTLFVADGQDPQAVSFFLAMNHEPPAISYFGTEVAWRK